MFGEKIVRLAITKYTTKEGIHTCALDFTEGKFCPFYRTQRFGTIETCLFSDSVGDGSSTRGQMLNRIGEGGYLIPDKNCPITKGGWIIKEK